MKLVHVGTLISIVCLFSNCKKDLPEATQTGENTFGCFVNGKRWIPNGSHGLFVSIPALWGGLRKDSQGQFYFYLSARKDPSVLSKEEDAYDDMSLECDPPLNLGEYIFSSDCVNCETYCPFNRLRFEVSGIYGKCFSTNSTYTGKIIFTRIDTTLRIVSGTFEFSAVTSAGEIIKVTKGRFDIDN